MPGDAAYGFVLLNFLENIIKIEKKKKKKIIGVSGLMVYCTLCCRFDYCMWDMSNGYCLSIRPGNPHPVCCELEKVHDRQNCFSGIELLV